MSNALKFIPPRVPLVDARTGLVSREWYLFFQGVFDRIGGADGPSTTDVYGSLFEDAGSSETVATLLSVEQALSQQPLPDQQVQLDALTTEVAELRELVAALTKELEALKQTTLL